MACEKKEEVTRYLDGYEYYMLATWVSLRGELELPDANVDALGVLRERLPSALRAFAVGRLSIDTTAPPRYVPVTLPPDVQAIAWDDSKESAAGALVPRECGPVTEYRAGMPLVMARVAQRGARVQLTVLAWHVVADGRTIEGMYRIVAHVLDARVPLPADTPVPAFGQREAFAGNVSEADMVKEDEMWAALPRGKPAVPPLPASPAPVNVLDYVRYRLAPIRAYARAHGVGVQALLMAADVAAHREYNGMAPDTPVVVNTVVDTRRSPFAAPGHAAREVYSGSAVMHTVVTASSGSGSVADTEALIRHCNEVVRARQGTLSAPRVLTYMGSAIDAATGRFRFETAYPPHDCGPQFIVSNVGAYKYCVHPRLSVRMTLGPGGYVTAIYSYADGDVLELYVSHPSTMDVRLRDLIVQHLDDVLVRLCGSARV